MVYKIATEYARFPGPRFIDDGPHSGEHFRETVLVPRLKAVAQRGDHLVIVLDGARGYTASFLEEAFGGLVRKGYFSKAQLGETLKIQANDARVGYWVARAQEYIAAADSVA